MPRKKAEVKIKMICEKCGKPQKPSADGYTDMSAHEIIVCNKKDDCELRDYENWKKNILRHEIVHAFLFESGLDSSSANFYGAWAMNEEMVDWFAIQSPKIFKVFKELNLI